MANKNNINRDYIDNYAVKEFVTNELADKYFEDIDLDLRNVGMFGYTTELISNISEDTFNTASVLFRESFPNRAEIEESIYSHAAIFQLDDVLSKAASCKFILVLEEAAIIKNMKASTNPGNRNTSYFYIDKNTTIYVENIPYVLDYDIIISIVRRVTSSGYDYLFSARYFKEEFKNSLSHVKDPYVKVRRSSDGFIALEVETHQCIRDERNEQIITNSEINYPVVDLSFEGKLAGFEVFYTSPITNEEVQMKTLIVYSQPLKDPFCYYQIIQEGVLRLSFNSKDTYFMPEFNSNLRIILYMTKGADGNFDVYKGKNISLIPSNEKYNYANSYLTAAMPVGASQGGRDQQGVEVLKALSVEGYRTALALTTESDLQQFFNNYKYRFGNSDILFIKKRDDVYERVYSAFMIVRNDTYIYKTNTLNLNINLYDMTNPEKNVFIIEPGTVFTCTDTSGNAQYFRDTTKNSTYKALYDADVAANNTPYIIPGTLDPSVIPSYLNRPCSFAQWKSRKGLKDTKLVWELTEDDYKNYDNPAQKKFLLINPFLIKFTKSPNLVSTYLTYVNNVSTLDFTDVNNEMYLQFVSYNISVKRRFIKEKKYEIMCKVTSTMTVDKKAYPLIKVDREDADGNPVYHLNDKYSLSDNDMRVLLTVVKDEKIIFYTEMVPTEYDSNSDSFLFKSEIFTDDHITSNGQLRLLSGKIYRNPTNGEYYKVHEVDNNFYYKYDKNGNMIMDNVPVNDVTSLINTGTIVRFENLVNMTEYDDIMIPIDNTVVKIYTLYKRNYSEVLGGLVENESSMTDNPFATHGHYDKYIWTNTYATVTEPIVFMKSLESVRTYLDYEDYTEAVSDDHGHVTFTHDLMDVEMKTISFLRASTILDEAKSVYFFNSFLAHYNFIQNIIDTRLRNETGIDLKFYNTYGRSKNFLVGEDAEQLDTVNLRLSFDMWFVPGTDTTVAVKDVKNFIKSEVEKINEKGMNNLFISNLMRRIEQNFGYVDHIRFNHINSYPTTMQSVRNNTTDISDLSVSERRWYIPELLLCDVEDITINEYTSE